MRPHSPASRSAVAAHQWASWSSGPRRERLGIAARRRRDRPDLRRDPARVIRRREPGHRRDAGPAGQQVRLDLRQVAAQRRRGPHARDPDRFCPCPCRSPRLLVAPPPARPAGDRSGSVAIVRGEGPPRISRSRPGRPGQQAATATGRSAPRDDPEHPPARPASSAVSQGQGQGLAFAGGRGGAATSRSGSAPGTSP